MSNTREVQAMQLPIQKLRPFENHPFQVKDDDEMNQLVWSVLTQGVLTPLVVRPLENDEYEVISGHRRLYACQKAGIEMVPALIYALDRDAAAVALVDSNLHREKILPSEKAFAYKLKMDALSHQGASRQLGEKWSVSQLSEAGTDSERQIHRYIRLTELIPQILSMVDAGKIALTPAVELSYLQPSEQEMLFSVMDSDEVTPSLSQARRLRRMSEAQTLTDDAVLQLLSEVKGNQVEYVKVPVDKLRSFFRPDTSVKQMTETLVKAMDFYNKHLARQRKDRDAR